MIGKYYNENELTCLHDTVYNSIGKSSTDKELVELIQNLPENIKDIGDEWGLCDTVFNDMVFVWLRQIKN